MTMVTIASVTALSRRTIAVPAVCCQLQRFKVGNVQVAIVKNDDITSSKIVDHTGDRFAARTYHLSDLFMGIW